MATAETATEADVATPPPTPQSPLRQALDNIRALDQRQKLAAGALVAMLVALVIGTLLWQRAPDYAVLFSNYDERDGGEIIAALQQQNVPYRLSPSGTAIMVPSAQVHDVRLRLAAAGLPKGGLVGFEVMETQKLGVSQFHEQVNYQRALEGELSRTIQSIASVASARVHLAMPKQTAFLRNDQAPTASVMVNMRPGRFLDAAQVAGIVHLVSSSVPRMTESGVNIVDQNGNLLTKKPDPQERPGLDPNQLRYIEEVEAAYIRRIETILTPMVGAGNFGAQVTADIDFNQVEQTAETYKPNPTPDQAIRSQQISESSERDRGPQGVPGALTNQPPVPATAPVTAPPVDPNGGNGNPLLNHSRNATINYELDRTIQHMRQSLGQIRRLSVAVVVNHRSEVNANGQVVNVPLTEEEIARITNLVREAVGYNATRGDSLNVAASPFVATGGGPVGPLWKDPQVIGMGMEAGKYLLIALAVLLAYLAVIRPLLRVVVPPREEAEEEEEDEDAYEDDAEVTLSEEALAGETFEQRVERARELARDNPKLIAELIRTWMGVNEEGRK
ncbi:flagellar basal body M-ring protein FliF [Pseudothauera nasutitermitis]|uniref:Flagellar M-ring protein n=1 Tax=Pseudothauera nasutitermitis TaxID=2565930 RepID=A0A4S4AZT5_9RHOO|nr:flagellar basal-body MS-ring/collar protein FliF [Pseudothauera nasutitermitis]THF65709.1 flagellar basal body M-ring protein FliF [Pseudothauera nasutitermitis]